jgi:hypothetical protein
VNLELKGTIVKSTEVGIGEGTKVGKDEARNSREI